MHPQLTASAPFPHAAVPANRLSDVSWQTFSACWVLYAGYYFCRRNLNVAIPLMAQDGYPQLQLANLLLLYGLAYAIGQFAAGTLADRFGGKRIACWGAFGSVLCTVLMALRPSGHSMELLQIGNGLSQSCGWSSLVVILVTRFAQRERGVVFAWWGTSYVLGGFLATAFAGLAAARLSYPASAAWQWAFIAPAVLLTGAALLFAAAVPREPAKTERVAPSWRELLRNPNLQALSASYFFLKTTRYSFLYWLPLYLLQRMHYSEARSLYLSSLFEGIGFAGIILAGYLSDRLLDGRRYPVGVLMLVVLAFVLLLHPILAGLGPFAMAVSISLLGILINGPDLLMAGPAVIDAVPLAAAGRAAGLVNGVGSFGQLISAYVVVTFVRSFGWDQLFTLFVGSTLVAAALLATRWAAERRAHSLIHAL